MGRAATKGLTALRCLRSEREVTAACRNFRCASQEMSVRIYKLYKDPQKHHKQTNGSWTPFVFPGWWPSQTYMYRILRPLTRGNNISNLARMWGNRNQALYKQLKSPAVSFCPCMDLFCSENKRKIQPICYHCSLQILLICKEQFSIF